MSKQIKPQPPQPGIKTILFVVAGMEICAVLAALLFLALGTDIWHATIINPLFMAPMILSLIFIIKLLVETKR